MGTASAVGFNNDHAQTALIVRSLLFAKLEQRLRQCRLTDNARQRAVPELIVKRYRNGDRRVSDSFLHDPVAAPMSDRSESAPLEYFANL